MPFVAISFEFINNYMDEMYKYRKSNNYLRSERNDDDGGGGNG